VSNIFTEQARLYLCPGVLLSPGEVEGLVERILGERGSYWVPVWVDASSGIYVDLQYGSGKGAGLHALEPDALAPFEEIWVRFTDEGADFDVIREWAPVLDESAYDGYARARPCRYAFDEVRLGGVARAFEPRLPPGLPWERTSDGFRAPCVGSYLALNGRTDMAVGPGARLGGPEKRTPGGLPTPTTPCHGGARASAIEPGELGWIVERGDERVRHVELRFAGGVVHRAAWGRWHERARTETWLGACADGWDNCIDEGFVRLRGGALR
jgi:hypothetical protein